MAEYIECYTCNPTSCEGCNIHILAKMLQAGKLDRLMDDHHTIIETADVAPVVHGRWDGEKDHGEFREVECTVCGGILLVKWSTRLSEYRYCPNCGARMDGE